MFYFFYAKHIRRTAADFIVDSQTICFAMNHIFQPCQFGMVIFQFNFATRNQLRQSFVAQEQSLKQAGFSSFQMPSLFNCLSFATAFVLRYQVMLRISSHLQEKKSSTLYKYPAGNQ